MEGALEANDLLLVHRVDGHLELAEVGAALAAAEAGALDGRQDLCVCVCVRGWVARVCAWKDGERMGCVLRWGNRGRIARRLFVGVYVCVLLCVRVCVFVCAPLCLCAWQREREIEREETNEHRTEKETLTCFVVLLTTLSLASSPSLSLPLSLSL